MNSAPQNSAPEIGDINQRVTTSVRKHRLKIRVLTLTALVFGFLAVATSVALAWSYFIFILPRQVQVSEDTQAAAKDRNAATPTVDAADTEALRRLERLLHTEALTTRVMSQGTSILAMAVGVLGLGTMVLAVVVILSRRAAFEQLNASLAQISEQLCDLHDARPGATG